MKLLKERILRIYIINLHVIRSDCDVILGHIWSRLELDPSEWRKIYKALYLLDIIMKLGDPACLSDIKTNSHRIISLENFSYREEGVERGIGIRDKIKIIEELIDNPDILEEERDKAKNIRNKLSGRSSDIESSEKNYKYRDKYGSYSSDRYGSYTPTTLVQPEVNNVEKEEVKPVVEEEDKHKKEIYKQMDSDTEEEKRAITQRIFLYLIFL